MIPPGRGPGYILVEIMDDAGFNEGKHGAGSADYIEYSIPRTSKVEYTPPSPTTSGYSESGSEMDNHDSGRASELEGSPKVHPKRPDRITLGFDLLDRIDLSSVNSNQSSGLVSIEASALRTLVSSLKDTKTRLEHMETGMEVLIKALALQNKVSNEAVFKLSRTVIALGADFKNFKVAHGFEKGIGDRDTVIRSGDVAASTQSPDRETATFPRFATEFKNQHVSTAIPSEVDVESYDNFQDRGSKVAPDLDAAGYDVPRVHVYARVRKERSTDDMLSGPPTLPGRPSDFKEIADEESRNLEKLMSELELPGTGLSMRNRDDFSGGDSLTRISRFSDVESLMSAFDNEKSMFSDDEFDTGSEFDCDVTSPSHSVDAPTALRKDAEVYTSSVIIPSRSQTSIEGSQKTAGSAPGAKISSGLLANYKKLFKRKSKKTRAESGTSFTFVTSPLYEKELERNPRRENKKLKNGLSVESVISGKKLSASGASVLSSSRENVDSRSRVSADSSRGSPRALRGYRSPANAQLLRLQSSESAGDTNHTRDAQNNAEAYDNFASGRAGNFPNGNTGHDRFASSGFLTGFENASGSGLATAARREAFEDSKLSHSGVILDKLEREQADRLRFEQDEPPPKPSRPGYPKDSPRSSVNHPNGGYSRGTPAVPPKQKVFTPEELANHEAQEKLRQKQMEEVLLQQTLTQQQREAAENEKWLQQEERNLNPEAPGGSRTRGSSGSNPDVPPPPSVAPSKPPRKMSKPKDEIPHGPPQTKLEEVKTAPTMQLNRDNDEVYKNTMEVVKAVLGMNSITMDAKAEDLFNSVKTVGGALKKLCACLDQVLPELPEDFHREIDMAQRTTNKDLSQVINQLKLVQRFFATTQVVEYKKCLMAANQVLAIDAKNLLDVVDRARIRKIQTAQELDKAQTEDIRHGLRDTQRAAAAHEPEDVYPSDDFL